MSQADIYQLLKDNPSKEFTLKEITDLVGCSKDSNKIFLWKLLKYKEIVKSSSKIPYKYKINLQGAD